MMLKIQLYITGINYILNDIKIENGKKKSQYLIFDILKNVADYVSYFKTFSNLADATLLNSIVGSLNI